MKQSGQSVELIRELLGHSDIKTTESYLKRFDLSKKKAANEGVMKRFQIKCHGRDFRSLLNNWLNLSVPEIRAAISQKILKSGY